VLQPTISCVAESVIDGVAIFSWQIGMTALGALRGTSGMALRGAQAELGVAIDQMSYERRRHRETSCGDWGMITGRHDLRGASQSRSYMKSFVISMSSCDMMPPIIQKYHSS
jgi:hypothetical protein